MNELKLTLKEAELLSRVLSDVFWKNTTRDVADWFYGGNAEQAEEGFVAFRKVVDFVFESLTTMEICEACKKETSKMDMDGKYCMGCIENHKEAIKEAIVE